MSKVFDLDAHYALHDKPKKGCAICGLEQRVLALTTERDQLLEKAKGLEAQLHLAEEVLWEIYRGSEGGSSAWRFSLDALIELGVIDGETFEALTKPRRKE